MKELFFLVFMFLLSFHVFSQSLEQYTIAACGEHSHSQSIELSWTIGEIMSETYQNELNILSQGFQQSNCFTSAIEKFTSPKSEIAIYPNPVKDIIYIKYNNKYHKKITACLYSMNGEQLLSYQFEGKEISAELDLKKIHYGNCILRLFDNEGLQIHAFNIIIVK